MKSYYDIRFARSARNPLQNKTKGRHLVSFPLGNVRISTLQAQMIPMDKNNHGWRIGKQNYVFFFMNSSLHLRICNVSLVYQFLYG